MKVGFYQFDVAPGLPEKNLQSIEQGTLGLDVELLVLPELCTSGYLMTSDEALRLAIELPGDGIEPFVRIARRLDAWLLAGVLERRADKLYNTTVIVGPDGWRGSQRKVHLTTLERSVFAGGEAFQVFDLGVARVGVITCFDAWFPEASRQLVRGGAQLLLLTSTLRRRTTRLT
ncbi:MAG: hypothetical protein RL685_4059 [Pseudomonadota bacterium]